ncbi:MAG TPA: hypothetical protein VFZ09_37715 [Archangium sp.]|uniref:hypothetical protein n=1 Tax=Archangium sp. TaxID=1872627 RepID=UPI002E314D00|nr:hypothetical protein [Archangium sp.]HEX5752018.1 hypothetical protein [Archangium sp.]
MALAEGTPVISVDLPYDNYNLQLRGDDVVSRDLQLHRTPTEIRGRALGSVAQLSLEKDGVSGAVGNSPVNLKVRTEGDSLIAEGGFIDGPVTLRFSPKELHVYISQCRYELTSTQGVYEGRRSCDSRLLPPVRITVPAGLRERSPAEQAALLLFALAPAAR